MSIDWFTVIAQIVNFLILLWLLKRFLYKPILHAIDEREKLIAGELAAAAEEKNSAQELKAEYSRKSADLQAQSSALLKKANDEAEAGKLRLMSEARTLSDELSAKRQKILLQDEEASRQETYKKIHHEVLAVTKKVLKDLAGADLEEKIVGVFIQHLHNLGENEKAILDSALQTKHDGITIKTSLDLSAESRLAVAAALKDVSAEERRLNFETVSGLLCGIELSVGGNKIPWNVSSYLSSITNTFEGLIKKRSTAAELTYEENGVDNEN